MNTVTPTQGQLTGPVNITDLDKARLDIAWKWFELHAKQRTVFYNYFLIITGILLNGYFIAFENKLYVFAVAACIFGMTNTLCFWSIDRRNRRLTTYAENVIEAIERNSLFEIPLTHPQIDNGRELGLLSADRAHGMREGGVVSKFKFLGKMKVAIAVTQIMSFSIFLLGLVVSIHAQVTKVETPEQIKPAGVVSSESQGK